jgi:hypothetical protein
MGRPKLTTRETRIKVRVADRKKLLRSAAIIGFKRPEDFGHFDDEVKVEKKVEKKAAKKEEVKEEEKSE